MPDFISKLQYKNYEKGEFTDEKVRDLTQTIELLKTFPWDEQRGVDVQLTGPSVTIQDEYVNYLKIGLYFNGKFCLYYFDRDHHLYECHVLGIDDVCNMADTFFKGEINLEKFEKTLFSVGAKHHFETLRFDYYVNKTAMVLYSLMLLFLTLITFFGMVAFFMVSTIPWPVLIFYVFFAVMSIQGTYLMIRIYNKAKNLGLTLSAGKNEFRFGDMDAIEKYNKVNLSSINIYGQTSRSAKIYNLMEVIFKDGSVISVLGVLIEPLTFVQKFPGIEVNYQRGYFAGLKALYQYTSS